MLAQFYESVNDYAGAAAVIALCFVMAVVAYVMNKKR